MYLILFSLGFIKSIFYLIDILLPIGFSILFILVCAINILYKFLKKKIGLLATLGFLIVELPFIHLVPYLFVRYESQELELWWSLSMNPYMLDERVIELTGMIGAATAIGYTLGCEISAKLFKYSNIVINKTKSIGIFPWSFFLAVGVTLSYITAPEANIFNAIYTESVSLTSTLNFSSLWMFSYIIIIFAFCDFIFEENKSRKLYKKILFMLAIIYISIFHQLLKGDREIIPMIFGIYLATVYWVPLYLKNEFSTKNVLKIIIFVFMVLLLSLSIGVLRSQLVGYSPFSFLTSDTVDVSSIHLGNLIKGTWTAVLLTPLSVAGDNIYGSLPLNFGGDYIDLIASIIPGFLADAIAYERPLDGLKGPAWQMTYGIGGTHFSVVPFMNFRIPGVLLAAIFLGLLLGYIENRIFNANILLKLALIITIVMALPHWLWYGDKNGVNAFIIFYLIYFCYMWISKIHIKKI
ncbi:MAG: hypothetical protein K9J38_13275 [Polynucleobacter sp.]|nr:hypothetical protein [Polynucleobacter sp.]